MTYTIKPKGVIVPVITPVTEAGELDVASLEAVVQSQIDAGVHGIFVLGTTGEGPSVPGWMRRKAISVVVSCVQGRATVYVGLFSSNLDDLVTSANDAFELGADVVVLTPPNYYPLSERELRDWLNRAVNRIHGPVLLYNIPTTVHYSIPESIIEEFVGYPSVIGLKDSENDAQRLARLLERYAGMEQFAVLVGTGALMFDGLKGGASGIVPSVANVIPRKCVEFYEACIQGRLDRAKSLFDTMSKVAAIYQRNRTLAQSIAALKAIVASQGLCKPWTLPPIVPVSKEEEEKLVSEFRALALAEL